MVNTYYYLKVVGFNRLIISVFTIEIMPIKFKSDRVYSKCTIHVRPTKFWEMRPSIATRNIPCVQNHNMAKLTKQNMLKIIYKLLY